MMSKNESLTVATSPENDSSSKSGLYLTFGLDDELYGVEILAVQEIIGVMNITRVPRVPAFMRGVINLRGKVIPVIDLRKKFNMETIEDTDDTCIVVMQLQQEEHTTTMGILMDRVSEVVNIAEEQIEDAPSLSGNIDTGVILGIAKLTKKVVVLLDVTQILSEEGNISSQELPPATN